MIIAFTPVLLLPDFSGQVHSVLQTFAFLASFIMAFRGKAVKHHFGYEKTFPVIGKASVRIRVYSVNRGVE